MPDNVGQHQEQIDKLAESQQRAARCSMCQSQAYHKAMERVAEMKAEIRRKVEGGFLAEEQQEQSMKMQPQVKLHVREERSGIGKKRVFLTLLDACS